MCATDLNTLPYQRADNLRALPLLLLHAQMHKSVLRMAFTYRAFYTQATTIFNLRA